MPTSYNLTINKTLEVKSTQATNQYESDVVLIKMIVTPLKDGNQTITI